MAGSNEVIGSRKNSSLKDLDLLLSNILNGESSSVFLIKNCCSYCGMGKWKCIWCSKILEGESFMDLVAASMKEKGGQHVHGWENITLVEGHAVLTNKLLA